MFDKRINITINLDMGEEIMARLDELLEKIDSIALSNNGVTQAEIDEIKVVLAANTQTIAENAAGDAITKAAVEENTQLIDRLINRLAQAPAPQPASTEPEVPVTDAPSDTPIT